MSTEYGYGASLPPPPPPPLPPPTSSPRVEGQSQRRIAVPPPTITTSLAPQQGAYLHSQTPASATSLSTPFSPYAASTFSAGSRGSSPMALRSASSLVTPYNPQQWSRNGPIGGAYMPHSSPQSATVSTRPRDLTGMEGNLNFCSIRASFSYLRSCHFERETAWRSYKKALYTISFTLKASKC